MADGSAIRAVSAVASAAAGAMSICGCRRMSTVATAKLHAITMASRSPTTVPRPYEWKTMTTVPVSATPIASHVRSATRSPSSSQPSKPAT